MTALETIPVDDINRVFGWTNAIDFPAKYRALPLTQWEMAADDVILRHLFRSFRPGRHLEFGTWLGDGVVRCVEECDATVWTINLLEGETLDNGRWTYGALAKDLPGAPVAWAETMVGGDGTWVRTDAHGLIGRKYLDAGWGRRVCQIYADSRSWDTRNYPPGFFDSAFIDGGHAADIVANDTKLAIELVRPGGLLMWHDFCPLPEVANACSSTRGVVGYISENREQLGRFFERLFWVQPSWLLIGIRR